MSQKYEKPLLKPLHSAGPEIGHGVPCSPVGGSPNDACNRGNNAQGFACTNGSKAGFPCSTGGQVTGS